MLLDLLCSDETVTYNTTLSNLLGLDLAVYISLLLNQYKRAVSKQKVDDNYFFKLDREYIRQMSTFESSYQKELDNKLVKLGVLVVDGQKVKLCIDALVSLVSDTSINIEDIISVPQKKKKTKSDVIKAELRQLITTTNPELRDAYSDWIDSVFAKQGWLAKAAVTEAQKVVDTYSNKNLDLALDVIKIASIGGYRDMQWAISSYEQNHKARIRKPMQAPVKHNISFSEEVF